MRSVSLLWAFALLDLSQGLCVAHGKTVKQTRRVEAETKISRVYLDEVDEPLAERTEAGHQPLPKKEESRHHRPDHHHPRVTVVTTVTKLSKSQYGLCNNVQILNSFF